MREQDRQQPRSERENRDYIPGTHKHLQGTIWRWKNPHGKSDQPVLVISNDVFNKSSPEVNCVAINKASSKTGRTSEPIFLGKPAHIQCGKLHTIPKDELVEFEGSVEPSTLANVFAKIRSQLGMGDDRNFELLNNINRTVDELNERQMEIECQMETFSALVEGMERVEGAIGKMVIENVKSPAEAEAVLKESEELKEPKKEKASSNPKKPPVKTTKAKTTTKITAKTPEPPPKAKAARRKYTDDDRAFILNPDTLDEAMMERFGFETKSEAQKLRSYMKSRRGS